jgi:NADPH2:quinone reductase
MSNQQMRAAVIQNCGEEPRIETVPAPLRSEGQCIVRIEAAALERLDLLVASGQYLEGVPQLPYIPGTEAIGTVIEGGSLAPGTRVRVELQFPGYGVDGCFAEYVAVSETPSEGGMGATSQVVPIDSPLPSSVIAAAAPAGLSGKLLLERVAAFHGPIKGATILVLGATGAVGEVIVQLCALQGAGRVIAAGRNRGRLEALVDLGADAVVELGADTKEELSRRFRDAAQQPIDIVLDALWGEPAAAALDATGQGGLFVNFGTSAGKLSEISGAPLRSEYVTIVGYAGSRVSPEDRRRAVDETLRDVEEGRLKISYEEVPLTELPTAWHRQANSAGTKLIVVPDSSLAKMPAHI